MHYYQFNIGDFIKDSAHLDLEEEAIYRRLIDHYYTTEKAISLDLNIVSRAIRARGKEDIIDTILNEFFVKTEKGFKQKRIEKELKNFKEKSKKAKASAEARWGKASKQCDNDANAMRTHSEGNANHKPITNNQEPITKKHKTSIKTERIPYSAIAESYNNDFAIPTGNPQVRPQELSAKRKKAIKALWSLGEKTKSVDWFTSYFTHCAEAPNMQNDVERGKGYENWSPNFDYILRRDTLDKAREERL